MQAQQLFQRDAQTITPEALESVKAALASGDGEHKAEAKKKAVPRKAAGQSWEDPTLADWPESMSNAPDGPFWVHNCLISCIDSLLQIEKLTHMLIGWVLSIIFEQMITDCFVATWEMR